MRKHLVLAVVAAGLVFTSSPSAFAFTSACPSGATYIPASDTCQTIATGILILSGTVASGTNPVIKQTRRQYNGVSCSGGLDCVQSTYYMNWGTGYPYLSSYCAWGGAGYADCAHPNWNWNTSRSVNAFSSSTVYNGTSTQYWLAAETLEPVSIYGYYNTPVYFGADTSCTGSSDSLCTTNPPNMSNSSKVSLINKIQPGKPWAHHIYGVANWYGPTEDISYSDYWDPDYGSYDDYITLEYAGSTTAFQSDFTGCPQGYLSTQLTSIPGGCLSMYTAWGVYVGNTCTNVVSYLCYASSTTINTCPNGGTVNGGYCYTTPSCLKGVRQGGICICSSPRYPSGWQNPAGMTAGTKINAADLNAMRTDINLMRADANLGACGYSSTPATGSAILATHINGMRTCTMQIYDTCGAGRPSNHSNPNSYGIGVGTKIYSQDMTDLWSAIANAP